MYLAAVRMLLLTPLCIVRTPIIDVKCHSSGCFMFDHQIHTISNCIWDNSFGDLTCIQRLCYNCIVVHWQFSEANTSNNTFFHSMQLKMCELSIIVYTGCCFLKRCREHMLQWFQGCSLSIHCLPNALYITIYLGLVWIIDYYYYYSVVLCLLSGGGLAVGTVLLIGEPYHIYLKMLVSFSMWLHKHLLSMSSCVFTFWCQFIACWPGNFFCASWPI